MASSSKKGSLPFVPTLPSFLLPQPPMNYSSLSISTTREVKLKKERDRRIEALESQISSLEQW